MHWCRAAKILNLSSFPTAATVRDRPSQGPSRLTSLSATCSTLNRPTITSRRLPPDAAAAVEAEQAAHAATAVAVAVAAVTRRLRTPRRMPRQTPRAVAAVVPPDA